MYTFSKNPILSPEERVRARASEGNKITKCQPSKWSSPDFIIYKLLNLTEHIINQSYHIAIKDEFNSSSYLSLA